MAAAKVAACGTPARAALAARRERLLAVRLVGAPAVEGVAGPRGLELHRAGVGAAPPRPAASGWPGPSGGGSGAWSGRAMSAFRPARASSSWALRAASARACGEVLAARAAAEPLAPRPPAPGAEEPAASIAASRSGRAWLIGRTLLRADIWIHFSAARGARIRPPPTEVVPWRLRSGSVVLLSGCGFLDGAEIQEACCTLLALDRRGAELVAMAPDVAQHHVVDHLAKQPAAGQGRGVLAESARIVRGQIRDLRQAVKADRARRAHPPGRLRGGQEPLHLRLRGAADEGAARRWRRLVKAMRAAGKPQGFVCIAPVVAARVLGARGGAASPSATTPGPPRHIESWGARHVPCRVEEIAVDERLKVVSTPAYMLGPWIGAGAARGSTGWWSRSWRWPEGHGTEEVLDGPDRSSRETGSQVATCASLAPTDEYWVECRVPIDRAGWSAPGFPGVST